MVCSDGASSWPLLGTPARIGYLPVMSAAREGAQTGACAYQLLNRAPDELSASMCGVFKSAAPRQPRSWQPRSSARNKIIFGFSERFGAAAESAAAEPAERKSRRETI